MEGNDRSNADKQAEGPPAPVQARTRGDLGWEHVEQTAAFKELTRRKKAFIVPAEIFAFIFFMSWPILGGLTTVLDGQAVGAMTWASVYGFAQFIMILVILHLYLRQAKKWDKLVEEARREAAEGRTAT